MGLGLVRGLIFSFFVLVLGFLCLGCGRRLRVLFFKGYFLIIVWEGGFRVWKGRGESSF